MKYIGCSTYQSEQILFRCIDKYYNRFKNRCLYEANYRREKKSNHSPALVYQIGTKRLKNIVNYHIKTLMLLYIRLGVKTRNRTPKIMTR